MKKRQQIQKRDVAWAGKYGAGHGGNTKLPPIREDEMTDALRAAVLTGQLEPDVRAYHLGQCSILVGHSEAGWHMSIAHRQRYPTWDEVARARYELIPDEAHMAMILPPKADYINIHNFCFQLWEVMAVRPESFDPYHLKG